MPPLFSIITITRNNLTGLQSTADSISVQQSKNYEWIVIDGASQDGTTDFLKTTNSHWISEPDKGLYDAMNKGIDRAKGDYIIFLNAGDRFADPETLSTVEENKGASLIYGNSLEGETNKNAFFKKASTPEQIDRGLFTHHQAIYYKTADIGDLRYDLSYAISADYDFTRKFLKKIGFFKSFPVMLFPRKRESSLHAFQDPRFHGGNKRKTKTVCYIPKALCLFEPGGLSQKNVITARKEQFQIRKKDGVPWKRNTIIYYFQTIAYRLRRFSPKLYWWLKKGYF